MPERVVQANVVRLLQLYHGQVWQLGTTRRRGDYQGTMQSPGVPDLIAIIGGQLVFIEVKAQGGKLRSEQAAFRAAAITAGQQHVVGGLDEVMAWMREQGIVRTGSFA